jgi:hypothetical protein
LTAGRRQVRDPASGEPRLARNASATCSSVR